jgi:hypothetical protein
MASGDDLPWQMIDTPLHPEQRRAAVRGIVEIWPNASEPSRLQRHSAPGRPHDAAAPPIAELEQHVAGEAVAHDDVDRAARRSCPAARRALRRCPGSSRRCRRRSSWCASFTAALPFSGSSPTESSADRGVRAAKDVLGVHRTTGGANCSELVRRAIHVRTGVEHDHAARARWEERADGRTREPRVQAEHAPRTPPSARRCCRRRRRRRPRPSACSSRPTTIDAVALRRGRRPTGSSRHLDHLGGLDDAESARHAHAQPATNAAAICASSSGANDLGTTDQLDAALRGEFLKR